MPPRRWCFRLGSPQPRVSGLGCLETSPVFGAGSKAGLRLQWRLSTAPVISAAKPRGPHLSHRRRGINRQLRTGKGPPQPGATHPSLPFPSCSFLLCAHPSVRRSGAGQRSLEVGGRTTPPPPPSRAGSHFPAKQTGPGPLTRSHLLQPHSGQLKILASSFPPKSGPPPSSHGSC